MKQTVLLIDDEEAMRRSTEQALELAGFTVHSLPSAEQALGFAGPGFNGAVISDIRMPGMDGLGLLERLVETDRELPVILITGHAEVSLAVEAMRRGAYDFIEKPFSTQALAAVLRRALDHRGLVIENRRLRAAAGQRDDLEARLPGRSAAVIDLRRFVRTLGPSEADALITGPTGAGK
jgi:two-component system, NtrC family, C4-dicarboxylate transport response regulator DctD